MAEYQNAIKRSQQTRVYVLREKCDIDLTLGKAPKKYVSRY